MIFNRGTISRLSLNTCVLAAFLPIGSTFGAVLSWIILPTISFIASFVSSDCKVKKEWVITLLAVMLLLLFNYSLTISYVEFTNRIDLNLCLSIWGATYISFVFYSSRFTARNLARAIDLTLQINVFLFFVQFLSFYILNYPFDYSELTGGSGARNYYGDIFRASGVFNEPAEYAASIIVLLVVRHIICPVYKGLHYVSIISVFLSFSFVGIIQAFLLIILIKVTEIRKSLWNIAFIFIILIVVALVFHDYFLSRYLLFIDGSDGSNNTKIDVISFILNNNNYLYGGAGLIGYDESNMPVFMQGLYDLTFFGANITIFGLFIGLIIDFFTITLLLVSFTKREVCFILLCLIKVNVMIYASYWFLIFSLVILAKNKHSVSVFER